MQELSAGGKTEAADVPARNEISVVTGAFGFTGKSIAQRLLSRGESVRTLTAHPERFDPFGGTVEVSPFNFADRSTLVRSLRGASTLYNTYWIRFPYRQVTYEEALANTRVLLGAAEEAGLRRIVHLSITNPSEESPHAYFRGKAILEREIRASSLSHAILRPTVIFGTEDILINNIGWFLRRFPLFLVPGSGDYGLQPVFVEDVAELVVEAGDREDNTTIDAVGPETYTFEALVRLIGEKLGSRAKIIHAAPRLALALSDVVGRIVRDVILTRDELEGLMANLLVSKGEPTGRTSFSSWLEANSATVGRRYASELARRYRAAK
ncbi:MAG: NAD(P)H-binding protein [Actinobacteria bacterium]|nr:NAD(P)H-binding protein [Actinomycetota bacterium]